MGSEEDRLKDRRKTMTKLAKLGVLLSLSCFVAGQQRNLEEIHKFDQKAAGAVEIKSLEKEHRIDVVIGGKLFTSYQYGPDFKDKPVFYPVLTPSGNMVNRGFPIKQDIPGESTDHPHHQSVFFTYGSVNGIDYWNPWPARRILHKGIISSTNGSVGELELMNEWIDPEGVTVLQERKCVTFGGTGDSRWMDHDLSLKALDRTVVFGDSKEGMFAIRLTGSLEEKNGAARYLNAYGWETARNVWGKRAPWVALLGKVNGEDVTIAIFDHPSTVNHPSYWHARDYGLFSANPLGRAGYVTGAKPLNKTLEPNQSFHFRYRLVLYSAQVSKERLDQDYWEYVK
jgi:hypothetical protein